MKNRKKRGQWAGVCLLALAIAAGWGWGRQRALAALPAAGRVVVLDAGHGGWDPGRVGAGADEKDVNLAITRRVQEYLEAAGAVVLLTRNADEALAKGKTDDLAGRAALAREGEVFVSIHQNSYPSPGVKGAQTFYPAGDEAGKALATCIQVQLVAEVDPQNHRQPKENGSYYLFQAVSVPAVIVECGFLSNPEEAGRLSDPDYQSRVAWAVYRGILDYFEQTGAESGAKRTGILEYFKGKD